MHDQTLERAYAECRAIAKREAKNFYYSFVALPSPRRDAICAIYAFMRNADDLSDDESVSREERRRRLDGWVADWHAAAAGAETANPVFVAVRDATQRFNIPLQLLDELVAGTTMDLEHGAGEINTYTTFDDLYRYCYLVASVVGLVCIRIFGYKDPRAEKLAEETGIAFQLTNILRDVAEDAQRKRVYLPLDELAAHHVTLESLLARTPGTTPTSNERALLASMGDRAQTFYNSARVLLPLIDRESRPALWVLVRIYYGLLRRIRRADYDIFSRRISVPTFQKLEILAVGLVWMGWVRLRQKRSGGEENSALNAAIENTSRSVTVIGAGVAGMSAACALAQAGFRVQLVERRGYLGGRASSYLHPGVNEVIDNCQHVLFGCCTNLIGFYKRIGVAEKIHWTRDMTMIEPSGRRSRLGPLEIGRWGLPAPLHGTLSLLSAKAFSVADKLALGRAFRAMMRKGEADRSSETLGDWLRRHKQTRGAMDRFWRLVIASALNADIENIAVPYAAKVIRELFMNSAEAGSMGMSSVPLSELYAGAERFLNEHGSRVVFNCNVEALAWDDAAKHWSIATRAETLTSDYVVVALPFEAAGKLFVNATPAEGATDLVAQIQKHEHWPLCSVHLWFDREITDLPHAVLLDREIHWLYNKSVLQPWRKLKGSYVELVVSASRTFAALSREEAIALSMKELAEFFPVVKEARLEKAALVKEVRATFGVPPGIDAARPDAVTPWPQLFLAGDWINTGWPSTMESAARSGHLAADAVSRAAGAAERFLVADLKPKGLMRFV